MEEFEHLEEVMVRDHDTEEWSKAYYMMTAPKGKKPHWVIVFPVMKEFFDDGKATWVQPFTQIRKIQKPEPDLIDIEQLETIEQRMDKFEAILNGAIKHINEQIESIKKQLK